MHQLHRVRTTTQSLTPHFSFNYIVLVNDNMELRAKQIQKNNSYQQALDEELEELLAILFEMELNFHIQIERMKRELEQMRGFSTVTAFQIMDIKRFNYLDWQSMYLFLRQGAKGPRKAQQPTKGKINAIFRRLDLNADQKLAFNEFAEAIKPVDVYFTEMHAKFRNERELGEAKKMTQMQMQLLKKELSEDYKDERL